MKNINTYITEKQNTNLEKKLNISKFQLKAIRHLIELAHIENADIKKIETKYNNFVNNKSGRKEFDNFKENLLKFLINHPELPEIIDFNKVYSLLKSLPADELIEYEN